MQFSEKYFQINRFLYIFVLTFVVSAAVTGMAVSLSGSPGPAGIAALSLVIAAVVAAGAAWTRGDAPHDAAVGQASPGPANDESTAVPGDPVRETPALDSLEEQGITIKLFELIALGDRYGNAFSVAMIGVDYLEEIVDNYDAGTVTTLLSRVATALAHTLRMPDRVGEFEHGTYLVVLPETNLPGAIQIAERLRTAVAKVDIAASDHVHIHTTASVGVTSFRRGDDLKSLVERAGKALRQAQRQGRNRVLPDMAA